MNIKSFSDSSVFVPLACLTNIVSSIAIILLNKFLFKTYEIPNTSLTCFHFLMTFGAVFFCSSVNIFNPKSIPIRSMVPVALSFCGFVLLTNLSLKLNSIGTYQILKVLTMPAIVAIEKMFYEKSHSWRIQSTFIPIFIGVFLNSYFDVQFNLLGIGVGLLGVLVTSLYQVWVGEKQKEYGANSLQLLLYQAPLSALFLFFLIPFTESLDEFWTRSWSFTALVAVIASGIVAFSVNLSIYFVIGQLSPLTYNMIGHMKFCAIVISGSMVYNDPLSWEQMFGICLVLVGICAYTYWQHVASNAVLPLRRPAKKV